MGQVCDLALVGTFVAGVAVLGIDDPQLNVRWLCLRHVLGHEGCACGILSVIRFSTKTKEPTIAEHSWLIICHGTFL